MSKDIISELQNTTAELMQLLSSFSQEQFNAVPFKGSWTAGQLGEHLNKSYGVAGLLYGPVKEPNRDQSEKIQQIKEMFLNYNTKMKSPDFIVPENKVYDKSILINF